MWAKLGGILGIIAGLAIYEIFIGEVIGTSLDGYILAIFVGAVVGFFMVRERRSRMES